VGTVGYFYIDLYSAFIVGSHSRRLNMGHTVLRANYTVPA